MNVLIRGMEMPEEGWHKVIKIFPDGTVVSYYDSVELGTAIPVPPHGRLIDADALRRTYYHAPSFPNLCKAINDAPTIIPADKEGE